MAIISNSDGQEVFFSEGERIFYHPNLNFDNSLNTRNPFIPMDFNQDGITDFIGNGEENIWNNYTYFYEGVSETEFIKDSISTGSQIWDFAQLIDFDSDGNQDVLFSDGVHFFGRKEDFIIPLPAGYDPNLTANSYLSAHDFNGDNKLDILYRRILYGDTNEFGLYLSSENGYENVVLSSHDDYADFNILDYNSDGAMDIMVVNLYDLDAREIDLFINDGNGNFTTNSISLSNFFFSPTIFSDLEVIDIDNDGDFDIIYNDDFYGLTFLENISVEGSSSIDYQLPSFEYYFNDITLTRSVTCKTADFNNDSLLDLIVLDDRGKLYYVENKGGFEFGNPVTILSTNRPVYGFTTDNYFDLAKLGNNLNIYDYDQDGDYDVIYQDGNSHSLTLVKSDLITNSSEVGVIPKTNVYPNPSRGIFSLNSHEKIIQVQIFNSNGQIIHRINNSNGIQHLVVQDLKPGLYFLELFGQEFKETTKIIVE